MKVIYKSALAHKPKARESLLREIGVCLSFPVHVSRIFYFVLHSMYTKF
jgi:hypothetical protein